MIPMLLREAIRDASTLLGSDACRDGKHQWESIGGRACPYNRSDHCSQAVYSCSVPGCGVYDYGQRGGPGHADCENLCKEKP